MTLDQAYSILCKARADGMFDDYFAPPARWRVSPDVFQAFVLQIQAGSGYVMAPDAEPTLFGLPIDVATNAAPDTLELTTVDVVVGPEIGPMPRSLQRRTT